LRDPWYNALRELESDIRALQRAAEIADRLAGNVMESRPPDRTNPEYHQDSEAALAYLAAHHARTLAGALMRKYYELWDRAEQHK
jgi:hypothetical protein